MFKGQIKKSSVVILAALSLLAGGFSTAYADDDKEDYKFTIVRNVTAKDQISGNEQIWKTKKSDYASVKVTSASSPSSYTTYKVYNYDTLISHTTELKNTAGKKGQVQYLNTATHYDFPVNIRGIDNRGTAPNYSTVEGVWSPINKTL